MLYFDWLWLSVMASLHLKKKLSWGGVRSALPCGIRTAESVMFRAESGIADLVEQWLLLFWPWEQTHVGVTAPFWSTQTCYEGKAPPDMDSTLSTSKQWLAEPFSIRLPMHLLLLTAEQPPGQRTHCCSCFCDKRPQKQSKELSLCRLTVWQWSAVPGIWGSWSRDSRRQEAES